MTIHGELPGASRSSGGDGGRASPTAASGRSAIAPPTTSGRYTLGLASGLGAEGIVS